MTKKNTKRALITTIVVLLLCVTMLVGSTLAWFTDSANTGVNTIQAGTLDVALEQEIDGEWVNVENQTLEFEDKDTNDLWEPGVVYKLGKFRVANNGSLALKFNVLFSATTMTKGIENVLEVLVGGNSAGTLADLIADPEGLAHGNLAGLATSDELELALRMMTSAGNEYQGAQIDGMFITVLATQDTVEYDSNGNQYDKDATILTNQTQLNDMLASSSNPVVALSKGEYKLPSLANKDVTIAGEKDTVIDMTTGVPNTTGASVTFDGVTVEYKDTFDYSSGLTHTDKVSYRNTTITGTQVMYAQEVEFTNVVFENLKDYAIWTYGAKKVTFTNCTFKSGGKAVLIYTEDETHADITFNNCKFISDNSLTDKKAAIEVGSSPRSADTTYNIAINNCTITGFGINPDGINTESTLWGNKNSMDKDHLNVTINGVDVY